MSSSLGEVLKRGDHELGSKAKPGKRKERWLKTLRICPEATYGSLPGCFSESCFPTQHNTRTHGSELAGKCYPYPCILEHFGLSLITMS